MTPRGPGPSTKVILGISLINQAFNSVRQANVRDRDQAVAAEPADLTFIVRPAVEGIHAAFFELHIFPQGRPA